MREELQVRDQLGDYWTNYSHVINYEYCICSTINLLLLFIPPVDCIHSGIVAVSDIRTTAGY